MRRPAKIGAPSAGDEGITDSDEEARIGATSAEYMDYLADMILELRVMSQKADATLLSDLLELAYREAQNQLELRSREP